jgi:hypothetical protein
MALGRIRFFHSCALIAACGSEPVACHIRDGFITMSTIQIPEGGQKCLFHSQ